MKSLVRALILVGSLDAVDAFSAAFTVTTTNVTGPGSLQQAILDANTNAGADTIAFNIPSGGLTIRPTSALPVIVEPVTIDGFTQPGASPNTLADGNNAIVQVRLDGAGTFGATGLRLRATNCQVRGLSITRFGGDGVEIRAASNCVVAGNFIGLAPDGTAQANNGSGVLVFDTPGNRIGGTAPADRNVLSGNFTAGVQLLGASASNNVIEGNFIGTSPDGAAARPNFVNGVYLLDAPRNRIGGAAPGARNVISGNTPAGVSISGAESVENVVRGNFIGPCASGAAGLGSQSGVNLEGGATNRVGGSAAGEGNIISGNSGFGVRIDFSSTGNLVLGNRIGVGPTGGALQNGAQGILIRGSGNRLGGTAPGEGNEIANNAPGIEVELGTGNAIRGNSIHDNRPRFAGFGGLGIDLAPFGVTTNDVSDADSGPNLSQNFPLLTAATAEAASTRVQGTLNSRSNATFTLDFFSSPDCDPSGYGEGLKYLGSTNVTTDGGGVATFDVTLPVAAEGRQITATATDADGNTSELGPCLAATVIQPPQTFLVTNTNDNGPGSLRQALLDAQATPASSNNVVAFNINAGGPLIIRLTTPLAAIFEAVTIDGFTQPGSSANTLSNGNNAIWRIRLDGSLLGPGANGLTLGAPGCEVRGLGVAGFRGFGIHVAAGGDSSLVAGCHLLDNQLDGLCVDNASSVTIGGTAPAQRNVIHGNGMGIQITGAAATGNVVEGNFIGPDPTGAGAGNFGEGVLIVDASGNRIGGTAPGAGNRIALNHRTGVTVFSGAGNSIIGNSIVANIGLGIELFPGANGNLAAPTITGATILANGVQCAGTFSGIASATHTLHAYSSREPSAQGELYLGAGTALTDGSGAASFNFTANEGTFIGRHLTLTVTAPDGSTSEFSDSFTPGSVRPPGTFTVTTTADDGLGSLRQNLIDANNYLVVGNNLVHFNISGPGVKIIQPASLLPDILDPITIDGFTQPGSQPNTLSDGYNAVHLIQLDGALQGGGAAFSLTATGSVVRGLSITRFEQALDLGGEGGHVVQGNLIGVAPSGAPAGNTDDGIAITSPNNRIGGLNPQDRNVIGANGGSGIVVISTPAGHNEFHGNLFGLWRNRVPNELLNVGNGEHGLRFRFGPSDNLVGGSAPGAENVFGFNALNAVSLESGQRNNIFNNRFIARPVPTTAANFIALAPGANNNILPPTLKYAYSDDVTLRLGLEYTGSANTTYEVETYFGEKLAGAPFDLRVFKPIPRFNLTTDGSGQASREELIAQVTEPFARGWAILRDPAGNSSAASGLVTVVPAGSADLQTRLFAPSSVIAGSNFTVTVVVTNNGPATATNVTVRQILAPGIDLVSVSAPGTHTTNGSIVDFAIGNLAAGQAATITLTARGTQPTSYQLSARAQHQGVDPNWRNDVDPATVRIVPAPATPQADLAVNVVGPNELKRGELGTFTFRVRNQGPDTATGVNAAIHFEHGTFIESVEAPPIANFAITGNDVACQVNNLAPGEEVLITARARVAGGRITPSELIVIKASADTADPELRDNQSQKRTYLFTPITISYEQNPYSISWPAASPDVELQSTPNLNPPIIWTAVPTQSIVTVNFVNTFAFFPQATGAPPAQFFRLAPKPPTAPRAEFEQVSMELDGVQLPFTDWGQVSLRLPLSNVVRYVNVSYNNNWVIQNVPILSGLNGGVADQVSLSFPLGTNGVPVFTANTGFTITTNLAFALPPSTNGTFIGTATHILASGEQGARLTYVPARPLVGRPALQSAQARPGFPNREQRTNECAPAAIVNSLEYLNANTNFNLQLPEEAIQMSTIKAAIGWKADGAPVGYDQQNPEWVEGKKQHMADRNLPIVTELTTSVGVAMAALRAGYDLEVRMPGHAACVVGISELGDGGYAVTLSHDTAQGEDGGNQLETGILDPGIGKAIGTWRGRDFIQFIIERPQ